MRRIGWIQATALLIAMALGLAFADSASAGHPHWKHHAGTNSGVLKQAFHHPHHAHHGRHGHWFHASRCGRAPLHGPQRFAYGFPTEFRWGWFGAERFYPRTSSHGGYNDSYKQWAYRHGY